MPNAVQRFDLVPDDPEHDNGPKLTALLEAGHCVELPPGRYHTSEIKPTGRKSWRLVGRGIGSSFQNPQDAVVLQALPGTWAILRTPDIAPRCQIANIEFAHDRDLESSRRAHGLVINSCESFSVSECAFFGLRVGAAFRNMPTEDRPGRRLWSISVRSCFAKRCEVGFEFNGLGKGTMGAASLTDCMTEVCPTSLLVESWRRGLTIRNFAEHRGLVHIKRSRVLIDGMYCELAGDDAREFPLRIKDSQYSMRGVLGKARIENSVASDCNPVGIYRPPVPFGLSDIDN